MLFNSAKYLVFLPIVFVLYWIVPQKYRWVVLLISSYYFYMGWNMKYVVLIMITTVVSYIAAIQIEKAHKRTMRRVFLIVTLIVCFGILFFFKYFNFAFNSLSVFFGWFSIKLNPVTLKVILPVGISFYTFQTLSYVIDVYKGEMIAERHLGKYATYISFFPQLVAGPIERASNLLPQILGNHEFDYCKAVYGLRIMLWGFVKKIVIADTLAIYVDKVYNNVSAYHGFSLILATAFFAFQIYCDFSGYSDIALGTAKLFGIDLMRNFDSPYLSSSIKEFWGRWHISLSTWFRDYLYIPLGGNRVGLIRNKVNIMLTFLISGLWHGANWTYVIWGGVHGFAQIIESFFRKKTKSKRYSVKWVISVIITFCFCSFTWIFFRAETINDSLYVVTHLLHGARTPIKFLSSGIIDLGIGKQDLLIIACSLVMLFVGDFYSFDRKIFPRIDTLPLFFRWFLYIAVVWIIILLSPVSSGNEFIYFQF